MGDDTTCHERPPSVVRKTPPPPSAVHPTVDDSVCQPEGVSDRDDLGTRVQVRPPSPENERSRLTLGGLRVLVAHSRYSRSGVNALRLAIGARTCPGLRAPHGALTNCQVRPPSPVTSITAPEGPQAWR